MAARSTSAPGDDLFARWMAAHDRGKGELLEALELSPRLTRLFAAAVCRDIWELLTDERSRAAVEVAEWFADAKATVKERRAAHRAARDAYAGLCEVYGRDQRPEVAIPSLAARVARAAIDTHANAVDATHTAAAIAGEVIAGGDHAGRHRVRDRQGRLLAVIVGPGYELLPAWHTSTAVALARGIYDDRAFDRMPILADALQDADCDDAAVLDHCRGPGPFVRGDWVVDSLLGLS